MLCAYVLGKLEPEIDWVRLIEGGIFEFLHRLVLTDIKPPIFHRLMEEKGRELNAWAVEQIMPEIASIPGGFAERFARYFMDETESRREKAVLEGAHYLATQWEFGTHGMFFDLYAKQKLSGLYRSFGRTSLSAALVAFAQNPRNLGDRAYADRGGHVLSVLLRDRRLRAESQK